MENSGNDHVNKENKWEMVAREWKDRFCSLIWKNIEKRTQTFVN